MLLMSYAFYGHCIPMVDVDGLLYTSSRVLCEMYDVSLQKLRTTYDRNCSEFLPTSFRQLQLEINNDELCRHLKLPQARPHTAMWGEDDLLTFAYTLRSPQATALRKAFRQEILLSDKRIVHQL